MIEDPLPPRRHRLEQGESVPAAILKGFGDRRAVVAAAVELRQREGSVKQLAEFDQQTQLVARGQLNVDPLNGIGVLTHAPERDHHILVDLERIGVAGDRSGARAVEPEFLARIRADRDEPLAMTGICQPHDFARGGSHRRFVITDDVAKQHHLGQDAALALGRVPDGAQVALIQVLEPGKQGAARASGAIQVILDLDDRRDRIAGLAEELQAHCARVAWHAVKHPARRSDQAIAAFFLDPGKSCEKLVGHILAKPGLAKARPVNLDDLAAQQVLPGGMRAIEPLELEAHKPRLVYLAEVVIQAGDVKPVAIGIHHAPPGEVIQCRAPQHSLLAAGIHGDVAAHARCLGRGRIDREHEARVLGSLGDPLGDDPGARPHRGDRGLHPRQRANLDRAELVEFFGIDDDGFPGQGDRAARVAGTAATRNDREPELDATAHQAGDLVLGIRGQDDKGILDPPIGGVGDMGDA